MRPMCNILNTYHIVVTLKNWDVNVGVTATQDLLSL